MATLADVAAGMPSAQATYRDYVIACAEKGVTPMSQPDWIKAGRPSGL
jgi:hypothetical protein